MSDGQVRTDRWAVAGAFLYPRPDLAAGCRVNHGESGQLLSLVGTAIQYKTIHHVVLRFFVKYKRNWMHFIFQEKKKKKQHETWK